MDIARFKKTPIMGILRGIEMNQIEPLLETIISSGLETIEITMNTKGAQDLIRKAIAVSKNNLMIGAGTVTNMDILRPALDAGATYIVMPVLVDDVLEYCVKNRIPAFPGALSPQEIYNCWLQGATMVKVFPAKFFGPGYFQELKGPFTDIELLACGGVTPENMNSYFSCGADAISFGSSVFKREWLANSDYKKIGECIKNYLQRLPINLSKV